jgi:hypothetical protein
VLRQVWTSTDCLCFASSESLLVWSQRGTRLSAEAGLDEHGFSVLGEQ